MRVTVKHFTALQQWSAAWRAEGRALLSTAGGCFFSPLPLTAGDRNSEDLEGLLPRECGSVACSAPSSGGCHALRVPLA